MLAWLQKSIITYDSLADDIRQGDYVSLRKKLQRLTDNERKRFYSIKNPYTLLELCISYADKNAGWRECLVSLLDTGACPNNKDLMDTFIRYRKTSLIKLFALYGVGISAGDKTVKNTNDYSEIINQTFAIGNQIREKLINLQDPNISKRMQLNDHLFLMKNWASLAENETDPVFKAFYLQKSENALKQTCDLLQTIPVMINSELSNALNQCYDYLSNHFQTNELSHDQLSNAIQFALETSSNKCGEKSSLQARQIVHTLSVSRP